MRGRGLKPREAVALNAGPRSPAMRGRGLKLFPLAGNPDGYPSPAMRGRGLKRAAQGWPLIGIPVARHARAWIET